jgi:hypothetical protein
MMIRPISQSLFHRYIHRDRGHHGRHRRTFSAGIRQSHLDQFSDFARCDGDVIGGGGCIRPPEFDASIRGDAIIRHRPAIVASSPPVPRTLAVIKNDIGSATPEDTILVVVFIHRHQSRRLGVDALVVDVVVIGAAIVRVEVEIDAARMI